MTVTAPGPRLLVSQDAATYSEWFASLAEPTRVRLLHAVATCGRSMTVGELTELPHRPPARRRRRDGRARSPAPPPGRRPRRRGRAAARTRRLDRGATDRREGIATGDATFETEVPSRKSPEAKWLPDHRWIAEVDGTVAGWAAATPVSTRDCYAGVAETSAYVGEDFRGRGVGRSLLRKQVMAADEAGLWTLQTSIFPENRASLALHHSAGFRTLGVRERIAQHHSVWRDTVFLERRAN